MKNIGKWIREHYNQIVNSIAFYPAVIALLFLLFSWLMLVLDFSSWGKAIKSSVTWIQLKDASTARSMTSVIAAGIISLTVFSFSMVMIVLNQAASYMSNRILDNLIGNRAQQITLGIYIGTIVYALFLLSSIRDIDSGTRIPSLSILVLIALTVIDIFIFIYFLHYVTQSIKYQTIIHRIAKETQQALDKEANADTVLQLPVAGRMAITVPAPTSGYYQGANLEQLEKQAHQLDALVKISPVKSTFLLEGAPLMTLYITKKIEQKQVDELLKSIDFYEGQPIERNPFYGFKQLVEVAVKALSPGINDPSTAVLSLQALARLLAYRLHHPAPEVFTDKHNKPWLFQKQYSFNELFYHCVQPIWNYGKEDQYIQDAMHELLLQLKYIKREHQDIPAVEHMLELVNRARAQRPLPKKNDD